MDWACVRRPQSDKPSTGLAPIASCSLKIESGGANDVVNQLPESRDIRYVVVNGSLSVSPKPPDDATTCWPSPETATGCVRTPPTKAGEIISYARQSGTAARYPLRPSLGQTGTLASPANAGAADAIETKPTTSHSHQRRTPNIMSLSLRPVSYTHLTLPTIYSV